MMETYHYNGEFWYRDRRSLPGRLRRWLIWVGGWEQPDGRGGASWRFSIPWTPEQRIRLAPTPVSLFGHRVTFYGWGGNLRLPTGDYLVWSRCDRAWRVYLSPDGTPRGRFGS
jgi:hypothetical protein